jgi:diguanylate cyclase (GGDEF)-like protein
MSFRSRLTLFFVLIVIVPMVAVTLVVFRLISDNESGKADARVAALQEPAIRLYRDAVRRGDAAARRVAADERLAASLRAGARTAIDTRAREIAPRLRIQQLLLLDPDRHVLADVGAPDAVFPATRELRDAGATIATLQVSVERASDYAALVKDVTGQDVAVRRGGRTLASTLPAASTATLPPGRGEATIAGHTYRVASFPVQGVPDQTTTVSILYDERTTARSVANARWVAGGILLGFFILAFAFAVAVSRSLQRQIHAFLEAARRLGGGEFGTKVPTVGNDEFAALGQEFNTMAAQLEHRLRQLREERDRVERSMRRLGEAVASNLDRDALLTIVVEAAVEGVAADGGRATIRRSLDGPLDERVQVGDVTGLDRVLRDVEARALEGGTPSDRSEGDLSALAHPLRGTDGPDVLGVVSVARRGQPFTEGERELFNYLAGQAAVSIENVGLHETVQRQATIDALTGLSTRRRFDDVLAAEFERAKRFPEQGLGLVLLDIDDFKSVNDTHGHQVGDEVLREVSRVLTESSREIDTPSRYGGEELAVILPGTGIEGAYDMAERVRAGIEALEVALNGPGGKVLRVTASFGAAAMPESGDDPEDLVAAADAALYEAKRAGKNRTFRAGVG